MNKVYKIYKKCIFINFNTFCNTIYPFSLFVTYYFFQMSNKYKNIINANISIMLFTFIHYVINIFIILL